MRDISTTRDKYRLDLQACIEVCFLRMVLSVNCNDT